MRLLSSFFLASQPTTAVSAVRCFWIAAALSLVVACDSGGNGTNADPAEVVDSAGTDESDTGSSSDADSTDSDGGSDDTDGSGDAGGTADTGDTGDTDGTETDGGGDTSGESGGLSLSAVAPPADAVPVWDGDGYVFRFSSSDDTGVAEYRVSTFNLDTATSSGVTTVPASGGQNNTYTVSRDISLEPGQNYRWRVFAHAADGAEIARSEDNIFTVPAILLEQISPGIEDEVVINELGTYRFYARINNSDQTDDLPSLNIDELRVSTTNMSSDVGTGVTTKPFGEAQIFMANIYDAYARRNRYDRSINLEPGQRYRWRLFAHDAAGNEVARSQDAFFTAVVHDGSDAEMVPPRHTLANRGPSTFITIGQEGQYFGTSVSGTLSDNCRETNSCNFVIEVMENYLDCLYTDGGGVMQQKPNFKFSVSNVNEGLTGKPVGGGRAELLAKSGDSFWFERVAVDAGEGAFSSSLIRLLDLFDQTLNTHYATPGSLVESNRAGACGTLEANEFTERYAVPTHLGPAPDPVSDDPTQIYSTSPFHFYSRPQLP